MEQPTTLTIDDIKYVRADSVSQKAEPLGDMDYVIVRTYSAGVHAGYLKSRNGKEVELVRSRRLWYWDGAASLSQLAQEGVSKPGNCKFPCEVGNITLTEAVEVIQCTEAAKQSIAEVVIWKK